MKLKRNKKNLNTSTKASILGALREEFRKWEEACQSMLALGQRLGYKDLAIFMCLSSSISEETNSGCSADGADGYDGGMNRAVSFLAKASQKTNESLWFDSIGQLKNYAKKAFKSAAVDAGRNRSKPQKQEVYNESLGKWEMKVVRVKRMNENPKTGAHFVDLIKDSYCAFDCLERQELHYKFRQLFDAVLSECKQEKYVQALRMDIQGLKGPQIANALGTSHANARKLLSRAKTYVGEALMARPDARWLIQELIGSRIEDWFESSKQHVGRVRSKVVDMLDEKADEKYSLCIVS